MQRDTIPADIRRAVLIEAGHRCAIPTCRATTTEIAHIVPWAESQDNSFDNLIVLCPNCHTRFDQKKDIDRLAVRIYKRNLRAFNSSSNEESSMEPVSFEKGPRVLFVETKLIIPVETNQSLRISFGLMNIGDSDAIFSMRDHTYYFCTDPTQTVFKYQVTPPEDWAISAIPNAIWHGEIRFDFQLTPEKLIALRCRKARLFFYARGEYRDGTGRTTLLPFAEMFDELFPRHLVACPKGITFE